MAKRVYAVRAVVYIPVLAENDIEAEEIGREHIKDEVDNDIFNHRFEVSAQRVFEIGEFGFDGDVIPWNSEPTNGDNEDLSELLGE